jgi:hypothetical protein
MSLRNLLFYLLQNQGRKDLPLFTELATHSSGNYVIKKLLILLDQS